MGANWIVVAIRTRGDQTDFTQYTAEQSRLSTSYGWSPSASLGASTWIKADLGVNQNVVIIRTKGYSFGWVTQFTNSLSINGVVW